MLRNSGLEVRHLEPINRVARPGKRGLEPEEATAARQHVLADPVSYRKGLWPEYQ